MFSFLLVWRYLVATGHPWNVKTEIVDLSDPTKSCILENSPSRYYRTGGLIGTTPVISDASSGKNPSLERAEYWNPEPRASRASAQLLNVEHRASMSEHRAPYISFFCKCFPGDIAKKVLRYSFVKIEMFLYPQSTFFKVFKLKV